jgi:hypothetical protein
MHWGLVLLSSTQRVLSAEETLKAAGIKVRLVPLPEQLSEKCGVGLRFAWEDRDAVEQALGSRYQYRLHDLG